MSAPLDLEPIKARSDVAREKPCLANWERTGEDVPALITEIERLRVEAAEREAYAAEGWLWVDEALEVLGIKTVFEIQTHPGVGAK